MNAAGIDVSSRKRTVAVLRPFGEVVRFPFDVVHSTEGLASLAEQLKALDGETRVVMEHTGRCYEPALLRWLFCATHLSYLLPAKFSVVKSYLGLDFLFAGCLL